MEKKESHNRIIIVGNGFDLAHGMKTSYSNFIDWLWNKKVDEINKKILEKDDDFKERKEAGWPINIKKDKGEIMTDKDKLFVVEEGKSHFDNAIELKKWIRYENKLLETLERKKDELEDPKWSDIEDVYYNCLIKCHDNYYNEYESKKHHDLSIIKLNQEFSIIKALLREYLSSTYLDYIESIKQIESDSDGIIDKASIEKEDKQILAKRASFELFKDRMRKIIEARDVNNEEIGKIVFVCFNYTKTLFDVYGYKGISDRTNEEPEVIYIHGNLDIDNDKHDSMIFGYGDEMDSNSLIIQENKDNAFLEFNKAVLYARSGEYQKIVPYIYGDDDFEVYILGHSCANCDRALLNEILDNKHCKLIKYFYYEGRQGKDMNFKEQISNMYRIFGDNHRDFRRVFCPLQRSEPMPQFEISQIDIEDSINIIRKTQHFKQSEQTLNKENDYSKNRDKKTKKILGITFLKIPGGWLDANTKLEDFWIGKYPITQKQWKNIMGYNLSNNKGDNYPVENISYYDCLRFILEINSQSGLNFSLPTKEQWMFAAQGGEKTALVRNEFFEGNLDNICWYNNNSKGTTHVVGRKKTNKLGLNDMCGNVWEFVQGGDLYGGSFRSVSEYIPENNTYGIRISSVRKVSLHECFDDNGFRLVFSSADF